MANKLMKKDKNLDYNASREKIIKEFRVIFSTLSAAGFQILEDLKI